MTALRVALIGAPNSGKSTLFNGLTGGRAKVANFPGVTVERRSGVFVTPKGRTIDLIDLPGVYGLLARTKDAEVTVGVLTGQLAGERAPDALVVLIEASILRTHLHSVLELKALGRPMILALNMIDLAERDGVRIDVAALERRLGMPVVPCRATRAAGRAALLSRLDEELGHLKAGDGATSLDIKPSDLKSLQREARSIAKEVILTEPGINRVTRATDRLVLHPVAGPLILVTLLFLVFQAVYAWSAAPIDAIDASFGAFGDYVKANYPEGWLRSLVIDGLIAGVGSVVIFLPQIAILFVFILSLEASGYMARAAFLTDELMSRVGLNGRAVIPLLSSFACAVPGIMATRAIEGERDRLTTILIAPLMTCSARLPVYALVIGAFIPRDSIGPFNLQGLVLLGLYAAGIASAILVAYVLRRTVTRGTAQPLLMELPSYKLPDPKTFLLDLWMRVWTFLKRAGTIILGVSIALWFLASYPRTDEGVHGSFAGMIGRTLEPVLAPVGFNTEIAIALVPGLAAREVAVAALGTVYSLQGAGEQVAASLGEILRSAWSLPTALAFLAWYVFAPQCLSTLVMARREMNSAKLTAFMIGYLFALAYIAAGATYWIARWLV